MLVDHLQIEHVHQLLKKSWSSESSTKWSQDNPARGQCGVTALVVQDLLGGEIKKTLLLDGWHFYNIIDGKRYDFTASQFNNEMSIQIYIPTEMRLFLILMKSNTII